MKNAFKVWALMAIVPVAVLAQSSLDEEVNAELDRMYQSGNVQPQAQRMTGPAVQVNVQAQPAVTTTQTNNQGTSQTAGAAQTVDQAQVQLQAQKQPTTVIEASPLTQSKADLIRKSRQDAELSTEEKIVEKLELSRLEDERRRAETLFGDKFNTMMTQGQQQQQAQAPVINGNGNTTVVNQGAQAQQQQAAQQTAVVPVVPVVVPEQVVATPAPVPVATPVAAPIEEPAKEEELDRDAIRGELSAALAEFKKEEKKPESKTYFSVMAGSGDYPDAVNVKGQYSFGLAFGKKFDDRLVAEGSFLYSNYQVEQRFSPGNGACFYDSYGAYTCYPRITEMNQYSTSALVKYQLLGGSIRPEIGGLVSYTYRTFADKQFAITDAVLTSQAFDVGLMAGVSLELSESFSIGLDYRHMMNMTNKVDGNTLQKSSLYGPQSVDKPIEEISYYNMSIVGRATF